MKRRLQGILNFLYTKLGKFFNHFLGEKRREMGQNEPHQVNDSKPWEHQKLSCCQSGFFLFIYVQMDTTEELPRTFYLDSCILYYIFQKE